MANDESATTAVQRLFLQHSARLRGFVLGLVPDRAAAEDLFQEIFLTVTHKAEDFRVDGSFLAWARGIARLKALEHFRKNSRLPRLLDDDLLEALAASAGNADDTWEERRSALAACIQELAPRARQILEMRYAETPVSPSEIAQRLTWTVNAVHVALARARKFLQECTSRRLAAGEG